MSVLDRFRGRQVERVTAEVVQRRDPTAATRALRWVTPGRVSPPDWDAQVAFQRAFYANVIVYACVQAIASTIAGLPFRAGADPDKPQDHNPAAPLARLLGPPPGGPNPGMDAETLWHFLIVQYLVTGRLGAEIETNKSDVPVALWPLASSALAPIPSTSGTDWFAGFVYGRAQEQRRLGTDDVLYAWQPSGLDFRQPESAIQAAHLDVNVAVMQSRYDYAFLKNDARPPAVVVTEQFEDDDSYEAFKTSWEARHAGPDNAGRLGFLETKNGDAKNAISIETLGFSPKDAQAAQRHSDAMQRIALALGVPWSRLDASGRTFDNASEEDKIWWQQRLIPLLRRLQSAVNIQLAPRLGNEVGWFDLTKIGALHSRPEPVTQKATADVLVGARIMTLNEARADYGLPPMDGGDVLADAPAEPAQVPAPAPLAAVASVPPFGELPFVTPPTSTSTATISTVNEARAEQFPRGPTPEEHQARRARIWRITDAKMRNLERVWARTMRRLFDRQRSSVLARLESKRGRQAVRDTVTSAIFDPIHWRAQTADEVHSLYEAVVAAAGARVTEALTSRSVRDAADDLAVAFDLEAPWAQTFVKNRANQLAGQVTQTTYDQIRDTLAEGIGEGESIPDLAKRINAVFDAATANRATTIARTEVVSAFNGSAALTASQLPPDVVAGQEWIATMDSRTREWHAQMDGEVTGVGQPFSNGLAYPGDPSGDGSETVNCRCTVAFLTPDDMGEGIGRGPRMVPREIARAVLAMVRESDTETVWRDALRRAA